MSRNEKVFWFGFVSVVFAAVFLLPKHFAVSVSYSDSYFFGYNNRVAVLLLLGSLVVAGIFSLRLNIRFGSPVRTHKVRREAVFVWMGVYTAACGLMGWSIYGLSGFGESAYLIDRIKMLAAGGRPYIDFEFAYGPLLLYGPVALMRLHLNAEQSYLLVWWAASIIGVWLLAAAIDMLNYDTKRKTEIFSLFCLMIATLIPTTGLNLTLCRFVPASAFALFIHRLREKTGWKYQAATVLLNTLCTIALLTVSPEMALSFAVGMAIYLIILSVVHGRAHIKTNLFGLAGSLPGMGLAIWFAARLGEFSTLKSFSGGAYNFPILPAGHILVLLFSCCLASFYISRRVAERSCDDSLLIVLAVSLGTLFAALGRCDPGHVGLAPIGILLVGTLLASTMRIWTLYRLAFLTFLIILPLFSTIATYRLLIAKVFMIHVFAGEPDGETKLDERVERYAAKIWGQPKAHLKLMTLKESSRIKAAVNIDMLFAPSGRSMEAPFGFLPNQFGSFRSAQLHTGYFYGLTNAFTTSAVERKVDELRSSPSPDIIVPVDFQERCKIVPATERLEIRLLFFYPFDWESKNTTSVWQPLCDEISFRYHPSSKQHFGYQMWVRLD